MVRFNEIDFSKLKTYELDGGDLEVRELCRPKIPNYPFTEYNGSLTNIAATDMTNRYPYVDLKRCLAQFSDKIFLPLSWHQVIPVRAYITCHTEIKDKIMEILKKHRLEATIVLTWDNVPDNDSNVRYTQYAINWDIIHEAISKQCSGFECIKIRIRNIPLNDDNVYAIGKYGCVVWKNADAYCDFPPGTQINLIGIDYLGTLKNVEQYTAEKPLCHDPYKRFEIKFSDDLQKGEFTVLMYASAVRRAIFERREYHYELI